MYDYESKRVKVKCPECGKSGDEWHATATDSDGTIVFKEDDVDTGNVLMTEFEIDCPNCHAIFSNMGLDELMEFMEENKEVD